MTNTPLDLDRWLAGAKERVEATVLAPVVQQVGRVEAVADGIAVVSGLPNVRLDELVRFEHGQVGFALTLDRDTLGCVLLDETEGIKQGTVSAALARWYVFRSDRPCSVEPSIRWADRSTAAEKSMPRPATLWNVLPPRLSIAIL